MLVTGARTREAVFDTLTHLASDVSDVRQFLDAERPTFLRIAEVGRPDGYGVGLCGSCGERASVAVVIRGARRGHPLKPFRRCRRCGVGRIDRPWLPTLCLSTPWPTRRNVSLVSDTPSEPLDDPTSSPSSPSSPPDGDRIVESDSPPVEVEPVEDDGDE